MWWIVVRLNREMRSWWPNETGGRLGTAHFSAASQITLRMLSRKPIEVGIDFFRERIIAALTATAADVA